jgi:AcrR family transcriptional regulator
MSIETPAKRKYELRKRADAVADTRRRITEAAVELHGTVGPARTTISAVAERAGVQRHTVYRHFPSDEDLFAACSTHWAAENPLPDAEAWRSVTDPRERVRKVLGGLYSYYEGTAEMLENVYRDAASVPASVPALRGIEQGLEPVSDMLADAYSPRGRRRRLVTAAAQHAADFRTWLSLTRDPT